MSYQALLVYSESLVRQATLAYCKRALGAGYLPMMMLVAFSLGYLVWKGDRSWFVGVAATALVFGVAMPVLVYAVHLRNGYARLRALGGNTATFIADDATFTVSSAGGSSTLAWHSISEVWQYQTFWLLSFSKAHFMTLPVASLPADMRQHVLERIAASRHKS